MIIPEPGQIVRVRNQTFLVQDVHPYSTPEATFHKVTLESLEDHRLGTSLEVIWELEVYPRVSLLLADDVGLGKTVEAGLILQELLARGRVRKILILCPASLQRQWQDEMFTSGCLFCLAGIFGQIVIQTDKNERF